MLALAVLATAALPIAQAQAQVVGTFRVRPGLGVQVRPEFPGADSSELVPYLDFSVARDERPFGVGAPDDSLGVRLFTSGGFSAGPVVAIQGSRKESDVGAPVGKVPTTLEAGAFVQHHFGDSFRLRGEARRGVGGHDGIIGSLGADHIWRDGDRYAVTLGPRILFSDARYQRSYFGVSEQAALASGLEPYRPGGGIHAVAAASGLQYSLGGGWGLFGYARYERLIGDARKSPIVREFGSPNQFSAGLGVNRTFTIRL